MSSLVVFELDSQLLACRVEQVREVVRLGSPATLPGMAPGRVGVLTVRGKPLPVLDLRRRVARGLGDDVLVTGQDADDDGTGTGTGGRTGSGGDTGGRLGLVVDRVMAVTGPDQLHRHGGGPPAGELPEWVDEVLTLAGRPARQVFVVDLPGMVRALRAQLLAV